ncbi:MAG: hypothetical protein WD715_06860, partial [Dongiaceae bacterium]
MMRLGTWRAAALGVGTLASLIWLWLVVDHVANEIGWENVTFMLPHEKAALLIGAFAPLAFLWLLLSFLSREGAIRSESALLREEIRRLTYPEDVANERIQAVNASLRNQTEALASATSAAAAMLDRMQEAFATQRRDLQSATETLTGGARGIETAFSKAMDDVREASDGFEAEREKLRSETAGWREGLVAVAKEAAGEIAAATNIQSEAVEAARKSIAAEQDRLAEGLREQEQRVASLVSHLLGRSGEQSTAIEQAVDRAVE